MSGGDGAPGWTFEKVGLDFTKFDVTGAALVMQYKYNPNDASAFPAMHWTSNSQRFANATMWTLFFGGKDFAPSYKIDGINAQTYLQQHFFDAFKQVAFRVKDNPYVLGFDTLNEPSSGWIGLKVDGSNKKNFSEILGHVFTPIDAMLTATGYPRIVGYQEVKRFGIKETRRDTINESQNSCWFEQNDDIWKKEGIWGLNQEDKPIILKNDHFLYKNGREVDFHRDYLSNFVIGFTDAIRSVKSDAIIFIESTAEDILRGSQLKSNLPSNIVNSGHWYDVATIGTKKPMLKANFDILEDKPVIGKKNIQNMFIKQLKIIKDFFQGGIPTIIAEFGLPFDLKNKEAYQKFREGSEKPWEDHINALTMYYNALDYNLLHAIQWNYTPDNTNERGDMWNLEDLSIFSRDQQIEPDDINSGGRAIKGFCRPHFVRCAGIPLKMAFNIEESIFHFTFKGDVSINAPTILYIPKIHYPNGYKLNIIKGIIESTQENQLLFMRINENGIFEVEITKL